jgi:glycosyltransferase involved in cell wall biosynthesis
MEITVIFYTYNQVNFVSQALDSILFQEQVWTKLNLIISDDASKDGTAQVIYEWLNQHQSEIKEKNIFSKIISEKFDLNIGQTKNFLKCLELASGEYLFILEGDDLWINDNYISNAISLFNKNRIISGVFAGKIELDERMLKAGSSLIERKEIAEHFVDFRDILNSNPPGTLSACAYRVELIQSLLPKMREFEELADYGLNLFVTEFGPLYYLSDNLILWRHLQNSAWRKLDEKNQILRTIAMLESYVSKISNHNREFVYLKVRDLEQRFKMHRKLLWVIKNPHKFLRGRLSKKHLA